jgi:8-oxo-dGTP diphosphatase
MGMESNMSKELKTAPNGVVVKVALMHSDDQGRLLFTISNDNTLAFNACGKIEPGETHEQALIREAKEELDIDIIPETIKFYAMFERPCYGYVEGTLLRTYAYTADFVGTLKASGEVRELVWLDASDIGKGRTTDMGEHILDYVAYQNSA